MASLTSQIELFRMSKRELEEKFTKSELYFLSWRSTESAANLEKRFDTPLSGTPGERRNRDYGGVTIPEGLPDNFFNDKNELDLSRVTGREAYKYFQMIGIRLPIMPNMGKKEKPGG